MEHLLIQESGGIQNETLTHARDIIVVWYYFIYDLDYLILCLSSVSVCFQYESTSTGLFAMDTFRS